MREYLKEGAKVVLVDSRKESAEKAVDGLKKENSNYEVEGMYPNLKNTWNVVKDKIHALLE